jgi:hypothetical protein
VLAIALGNNDPMDRLEPIAHIEFTTGKVRPVYETPDGRQYVIDDRDKVVYGVRFIPPEAECDAPVIVDEFPF